MNYNKNTALTQEGMLLGKEIDYIKDDVDGIFIDLANKIDKIPNGIVGNVVEIGADNTVVDSEVSLAKKLGEVAVEEAGDVLQIDDINVSEAELAGKYVLPEAGTTGKFRVYINKGTGYAYSTDYNFTVGETTNIVPFWVKIKKTLGGIVIFFNVGRSLSSTYSTALQMTITGGGAELIPNIKGIRIELLNISPAVGSVMEVWGK